MTEHQAHDRYRQSYSDALNLLLKMVLETDCMSTLSDLASTVRPDFDESAVIMAQHACHKAGRWYLVPSDSPETRRAGYTAGLQYLVNHRTELSYESA